MEELQVQQSAGHVTFRVRVVPRASRDEIVGLHDGALKIALTAPPVEGAANASLVKLIAKALGIARRNVEIVRGETSRQKTLRVQSTVEAVRGLAKG